VSQGTVRNICMNYECAQHDTLKTRKHCRANLVSSRAPVERQILSVLVNDKLLIRMVNTKGIRYGSETTSPHAARVSFNRDVSKECQILRRIIRLRGLYLIIYGLKQDELHDLMRKVYFELF
jgi:hypothetical protein